MKKENAIRLDKWLSQQGFGSRTDSQKLVHRQKVCVNGTTILSPAVKINPHTDKITVEGQPVHQAFHHHIMLNKPAGYLSAASDANRQTVMDLLPSFYLQNRCMPVGRLDKDTTGLLLFTTDGALGHYLLSPKREVKKVYHVLVEGILTKEDIKAFAEGVVLKDFTALPAALQINAIFDKGTTSAQVTLYEGKYHQVKRMFQSLGKPVVNLHRVSIGSISLDPALAPGQFRPLLDVEVAALWQDVKKEAPLYE